MKRPNKIAIASGVLLACFAWICRGLMVWSSLLKLAQGAARPRMGDRMTVGSRGVLRSIAVVAIGMIHVVVGRSASGATLEVNPGPVVYRWGNQEYDSIIVYAGGTLAATPLYEGASGLEGGWLNLLATDITVEQGGSILAHGAGHGTYTGNGPGVGGSNNDSHPQYISGSGGGYGGAGGDYLWTAGKGGGPYGTEDQIDAVLGSAGGFYFYVVSLPLNIFCFREGGSGGGFLRLAADNIIIDGIVGSNGGNGLKAALPFSGVLQYGSGGGSGGELIVDAQQSLRIGATGLLQANGGDGSSPGDVDSSGGGSGGRIKVYVGEDDYENLGAFEYRGGQGGDHLTDGESGTLFVHVIEGDKPGDTNNDGIVDDHDYGNLVAQFGGPPGAESADFNNDGRVDLEDFAILRGNFDFGVESAPDGESGATTPEPATLSLLALGGLAMLRRRKRGAFK